MKKFKLGFMVGRFQMLHKGHESLINEGIELCDRFVILLGNSEESRTKNNPFTFEERKEMIKMIFGDKVEVYPIISIGIGYIPAWGNYIMNTIKFYCGDYPDFVLRGADDGRSEWLDKEKYNNITEYIINRNIIPFSATQVRNCLIEWYEAKEEFEKQNRSIERGLSGFGFDPLNPQNNNSSVLSSITLSDKKKRMEDTYSHLGEMLNPKYTPAKLEKYGEILKGIR